MTYRFDREIKAFTGLTAREGELEAAINDARLAMALTLKAIGREDALEVMNAAIDQVVAAARLLRSINASDRPSGSVERRSGPSRGIGARAALANTGERLSNTIH